jgi:CheY-like chemotaxis protein
MVRYRTGVYLKVSPFKTGLITAPNAAVSLSPDVLVVDNEPLVAAVVARYLEHAGMRVRVAESGTDALLAMGDGAAGVPIVLTDLRMRGMSGLELAREVAVRHPGTRVLFMGGHPDDGVLLPGPLILKPFEEHQLISAIRRLRDQPAE